MHVPIVTSDPRVAFAPIAGSSGLLGLIYAGLTLRTGRVWRALLLHSAAEWSLALIRVGVSLA
ncbi:hypothetical protein DES52_110157 [Deinococcus yavapaiensis KR-236]|uniref:Uncharacterized protein n=1 Tax=Deinococcus yavapaiensis KR-236 TaxID=694435 RepID=A0A318S9N3_9DEIO|nr:hypothetical protein DES52_110157 [Deinococcus yavapaiensis KR-236]